MTQKSLPFSEWSLVGSLLIIMASLVLIAKINTHRASTHLLSTEIGPEKVLVTIDGAVTKPGQYLLAVGTSVEKALRKAKPTKLANTKILPLRTLIEEPMHLHVEELKEITVFVRGEVLEPLEITLPLHARISDLKGKVQLTKKSDKSFFRRRKLLKNGEILVVPKKTVE